MYTKENYSILDSAREKSHTVLHFQCEDKGLFSKWNWRSERKHLATWPDNLEMKNANNVRIFQISWHKWTNSGHSLPSYFLPVFLCRSSSPATLSSPVSHLFFAFITGCWEGETGFTVCQPAADMPGKAPLSAEVLNKEPLGPGVGGQAVSLSALTVTGMWWCLPVLCLTTEPHSLINYLLEKQKEHISGSISKLLYYVFPSVWLVPNQRDKNDKWSHHVFS